MSVSDSQEHQVNRVIDTQNDDEQGVKTYIAANTVSIEFLIHTLSDISSETYQSVASPGFQSSIGAHYRHIIEHYQCFFAQFDAEEVINYDARQRNLQIETDTAYALTQLQAVRSRLNNFSCDDKRTVLVQDDHCVYQMRSSLSRELMFLIGHSEHHSAMIAAMLRIFGYAVDSQFGVANATINFQASVSTKTEQSA